MAKRAQILIEIDPDDAKRSQVSVNDNCNGANTAGALMLGYAILLSFCKEYLPESDLQSIFDGIVKDSEIEKACVNEWTH